MLIFEIFRNKIYAPLTESLSTGNCLKELYELKEAKNFLVAKSLDSNREVCSLEEIEQLPSTVLKLKKVELYYKNLSHLTIE